MMCLDQPTSHEMMEPGWTAAGCWGPYRIPGLDLGVPTIHSEFHRKTHRWIDEYRFSLAYRNPTRIPKTTTARTARGLFWKFTNWELIKAKFHIILQLAHLKHHMKSQWNPHQNCTNLVPLIPTKSQEILWGLIPRKPCLFKNVFSLHTWFIAAIGPCKFHGKISDSIHDQRRFIAKHMFFVQARNFYFQRFFHAYPWENHLTWFCWANDFLFNGNSTTWGIYRKSLCLLVGGSFSKSKFIHVDGTKIWFSLKHLEIRYPKIWWCITIVLTKITILGDAPV